MNALGEDEALASQPMASATGVVFLQGWCGHGDEVDHLRGAFSGRLLAPCWMPAPGSIDLHSWPSGAGPAMDLRQTFLDDGFADPVLIDAGVPMPPQRRSEHLKRMGVWIARARRKGRETVQRAWSADQPKRTAAFFHANDRGPARRLIERRMAQTPVVEAAAAMAGSVQWAIDAALQQRCPILAFAADRARLSEAALRQARPGATVRRSAAAATFCTSSPPSGCRRTWSAGCGRSNRP